MLAIEVFRQTAADARAYAIQWKKQSGGKVLGHFCSYVPEEMITAAGVLAFRILPSGRTISRADIHLQAYGCHLIRGTLEDVLTGELDFIDGTIFPHTCDSIQRLSDIWRLNTTFGFHSDLMVPSKLNTPSAVAYLVTVLEKFKNELSVWCGTPITDKALHQAIGLHNRIRNSFTRLYGLREEHPALLRGEDWHAVIKSALVMERAALAELLESLLEQLIKGPEQVHPELASSPKRVVLSGGLCTVPDIYATIEAAGGAVVGDELCMGARYFEGLVDEARPAVAALADRFATRVVCPAKHAGLTTRGDNLLSTVDRARAQGVIFLTLKFCDPHAFDYPYMKQMLDEHGIPSILLEIEDPHQAAGQMQTRCQAFMEMI
jgi:bcr-type benzoyl-CoA reductase subunit C